MREAQEIIGLAFFPARLQRNLPRLAEISKRLRRQRDFAFYGDEDFIPTAEYTCADTAQALGEAQNVVAAAQLIPPPETQKRPAGAGLGTAEEGGYSSPSSPIASTGQEALAS